MSSGNLYLFSRLDCHESLKVNFITENKENKANGMYVTVKRNNGLSNNSNFNSFKLAGGSNNIERMVIILSVRYYVITEI